VPGSPGLHRVPDVSPASPERMLRAACAVGDRLGELSLSGEQGANWLGVTYGQGRVWRLAPAGLDLYSGVAGIAFFLAYLGDLTGEEQYTRLSRSALVNVRAQLKQQLPLRQAPGGYDGWGSVLYVYAHLGALWQDEALLEEAAQLAQQAPALVQDDHTFDLLTGAAGTILCLLALYGVHPRAQVLAAALRYGEWLLDHAAQCQASASSGAAGGGPHPLTGMSHGAAGMAYSLLKLADVSKQDRFRTGALAAMAYERQVFSEARQNWPDFRDPSQDAGQPSRQAEPRADVPHERFGVSWCHGAPGIGLARLASLPYLDDDPHLRAEIASALRTTLLEGLGGNHCLCHGELGNLEALLTATRVLQNAGYQHELARLSAMIVQRIETSGWQTGVSMGVETPGLLTGIAGIGYELLRLARPERIPNLLILEEPPARGDVPPSKLQEKETTDAS
jgi:type 2 lantibiotic biosynthesis protein LanM